MRRHWIVIVLVGLSTVSSGASSAAEPEFVSMRAVHTLLTKLVERGALTDQDVAEIRGEMAKEQVAATTSTAPATAPAPGSWAERTTISGEVRLRNEFRDRTANIDANRQRLRAQVGIISRVTEQLEAGLRLTTGALTTVNAYNQSLDDTFSKKPFLLDRAYVQYTQPLAEGQAILAAGMFENPFWTPQGSQLVWDEDVSFAGAAARTSYPIGPARVFVNGGAFPVDTDGFGSDNPSLWSVQGGSSLRPLGEASAAVLRDMTLTGALAYHDYKNTFQHSLTNDDQTSNDARAEDFNELNPNLELATTLGDLPAAVWWDQVRNTAASEDENGFQVGLKVGKAKTPWSLKEGWEAGYAFERLEANAVFDLFTYSDFGGGGTNHLGSIWWLKIATLKNSTAGVKVFQTREASGAKNDFTTYQLDWTTKF
jgi:hypothetical protein